MTDPHFPDRRAFLRQTGLAVAAGAVLPSTAFALPATAAEADSDPDALFKAGKLSAAERGYRHRLRRRPRDARAHAQLGYIALLSNRFGEAEKRLSKALDLQPDDVASAQRLAECFVRQDRLSKAVPLLRKVDRPRDKALSELYSHISGTPWQLRGAKSAHVPFVTLDPVPAVEATVNGRRGTFWLDTYATLDLSEEMAQEAGLRAVTTISGGVANNQPIDISLGVLDSFRVGNIEIRNLPVQWSNARRPPLPDGTSAAGAFGTTIFYHFLTTMDYARKALTLKPRTATAPRARLVDRLPLWLAGDHFPCTVGSIGHYGPRMVTVDTGGIGVALDTTVQIAERAGGITVDRDHPIEQPGGNKLYPITAKRISLGRAVGRNLPGHAAEKVFPGFPGPGQSAMFGFDLIANFSHEFFKPYAITFDYRSMHLSINRG
ncbi:tetratricopeptide repeat protein [Nonomuraea mesophila]|uniref:Tetratricopeptide repeat protein n=1 Tax=Nonomuraea mesophila TaxID=2530382 RepID=A0A4R5FG56_9ACTN|nr:aspartyl protease family protein [Nonomuraea mesophila]TDE49931.1 tetratricopeptide repeat protein [Nonomuraea mesophila]